MYASGMQQWNKEPLIGFGVAGYQGPFIIRKRNGAIEQATQAKEITHRSQHAANEENEASKPPLCGCGDVAESRCTSCQAVT